MIAQMSYDNDKLLFIHRQIIKDAAKEMGVPHTIDLRAIANRKNFQLGIFTFKSWQPISIQMFNQPYPLKQFIQDYVDTMKRSCFPKYEQYYGSKIDNYCFFNPQFKNDIGYTFSIKQFNNSIFKNIDKIQAAKEEKIANLITTNIRAMYGKGPQNIVVAIMHNRYLVISLSGLIAEFAYDYCMKYSSFKQSFVDMLGELTEKAVNDAMLEMCGVTKENFVEINFERNNILCLVLLEAISTEELIGNKAL